MAKFGDLAGEIIARLPGLSPFLAETFIQRAFREIRDAKRWSWLVTDGVVNCPALVSAGTFAITQFQSTVTADATATTALTALNAIGQPPLTSLQIRFMGLASTSQIYNITAAAGNPLVLTLDRIVQEPTNALSPYMVYRVYIVPPIADFLTWISLDDMVNAIRITDKKLRFTSAYFDVRDPQRQALQLAYYLGFYKGSSAVSSTDSTPIYELWPGCTQGQQWYVRFRRAGTDPAMTDPVPSALNTALITKKAMGGYALPHMAANIGHFPALKGVQLPTLIKEANDSYGEMLIREKIQDDDQALDQIINRGHSLRGWRGGIGAFDGPVDSNFIQQHPITWILLVCLLRVLVGAMVRI